MTLPLRGLLAAALLLLAGCAGTSQAPTGDAPQATAPVAAQEGQSPDAASADGPLDFAGTTVDGAAFEGSELAGEPVAMWFWAPWCTICRAEAPDVAEVAAEFEGRVTVLGVPGRGEVDAMQDFVSDTATGGFTHVVDADGALWTRFGVVAQPTFVFVDSGGQMQTFAGSLDAEQLRTTLTALA